MKKIRISILSSVILSIFLLASIQNIKYSRAQWEDETLTVPQNFTLIEIAENNNTLYNISSIDIELPSSSWNVTELELNFTDIGFYPEIKIIEDNYSSAKDRLLYKGRKALAVQINLTDPIILYGVHIYGVEEVQNNTGSLFLQIQGYNENSPFEPNGTIIGSTYLNVSNTLGWHVHNFSSPIPLSKGSYYLVFNCTETFANEKAEYNFNYNDVNPQYPELITWDYYGNWEYNDMGEPFLYKLDQKINLDFYPVEFNMTAEIDGTNHSISNGIETGSGNLTLNLEFSPNDENLHIPIYNNKSSAIIFNLSYNIKIKKHFTSNGSVLIKGGSYNNWTITPNITRYYNNYSVKFEYSPSWENITVYKDNVNITKYISFDKNNHILIINNDTITNGAEWVITAISPSIDFDLIVPKTEFGPDQDLKFSVNTSVIGGNLTYVLIDALGYEVHRVITNITTAETIFSYILSSNPYAGKWIAQIYWNNDSDAGFQSQAFNITGASVSTGGVSTGSTPTKDSNDGDDTSPPDVFILDPQLIFIGVMIGIVAVSAGLTTNVAIKRIRRTHEEHRQKIFNKYMDALNLNYVIIMIKDSGLNIYEQLITGKNLDATLVSGFLQAIRSFGIDLTGSKEHSQTIKLEFKESKILMSDFKNFRLVLIMKEIPSEDFLVSIENLSKDIEEKYGRLIQDFKGDISVFDSMKGLIDMHLQTILIYPLMISKIEDVKVNTAEKALINEARKIMKEKNSDYFYVSYLMSEKEFNVKNAEIMLNLINKKILQPII
ncbi:MAG: hypothetical protein ACTSRI_05865 [Promethearchaeota archaeon]